jgi:hypothetical protein
VSVLQRIYKTEMEYHVLNGVFAYKTETECHDLNGVFALKGVSVFF